MKEEPKDALWFCSADVLPIKSNVSRKALTDIGFVFREDHDKNYVSCALPAGWTKKPASTWYAVLEDPRGNTRAYVYLGLDGVDPVQVEFVCRFGAVGGMVMDAKSGNICAVKRCEDDDTASFCLNTCYPDWRNPLAYWEEGHDE